MRPSALNARYLLSPEDVLDLEQLDRQRRLGAGLRGLPLHLRALLAVAVIAIVVPVTWLMVSQGRTLLSLGHTAPKSTSRADLPETRASSGSASATSTAPRPDLPIAKEPVAETPVGVEALRQSARQGDVPSQFKMGAKYAGGEGVPKDPTKAAYWFQQAALQGYAPAQGILGAYYWVGRGVSKDLKQAYFWSALALSGNDEISKQRVDVLAARLSRADMAEVQQRLREWSRTHPASSEASTPAR